MSGTTPSKRRTLAIAASAALAAGTLGAVAAVPASGTTGPGVRPGSNITVFHNIDFVAVYGYGPVGSRSTSGCCAAASSSGRPRVTRPPPRARRRPGGQPRSRGRRPPRRLLGRPTPDIKPGDVIRVTDGRGTDQVTVDNIAFTGQPTDTAGTGDVVVPFTALLANGKPVPLARLDSAEFRAGSRTRFEATDIIVEPDGSGTPGAYQMRYTDPFTPSRNRDPLNNEKPRPADGCGRRARDRVRPHRPAAARVDAVRRSRGHAGSRAGL